MFKILLIIEMRAPFTSGYWAIETTLLPYALRITPKIFFFPTSHPFAKNYYLLLINFVSKINLLDYPKQLSSSKTDHLIGFSFRLKYHNKESCLFAQLKISRQKFF